MLPYAYPKPDHYVKVYVNDAFYILSCESKINAVIESLNNMDHSYVKGVFYFEKQHALMVTTDYRIPQDSAE